MNTQEFIAKHKMQRSNSKLAFERTVKRYNIAGMPLVKCADAKLLNGRYPGMRLSDVFIFDPNYLTLLINNDRVDPELKEIVAEVMKNQSSGADSISRRIALG